MRPLLPLLLLLAACEGSTIKFPDTGAADDTGTPDTGDTDDTDTDTTDTDTGDTDTTDTDDPFEDYIPLEDADAVLTAEGRNDGVGYGGGLASTPDVTGDGQTDLLVGARYMNVGDQYYLGAAYIVSDPPAGQSSLGESYARFSSDVTQGQFGTAVSPAGDVDGDGHDDIAISAPGAEGGSVYIFRGPFAAGNFTTEDAATILVGEGDYAYTGMAVRAAGDVNNDGTDDLLVGSSYSSDGCAGCGSVYVNLAANLEGTNLVSDDAVRIYGDRTRGAVGTAVANGADLDGDGFVELAIGAPNSAAGGVALLYGPFRSGSFELTDADAWFAGEHTGSYTGMALTGADVNGDGYDDLIVGAPYDTAGGNGSGTAYVEFGSGTRWDGESMVGNGAAYAGNTSDYAGTSVTSAGDVDGDGTVDLLLGAPYSSVGASGGGGAYLVFGPIVAGDFDLGEDEVIFAGTQNGGYAGYSVSGAGDLDGDGDQAVAVGALYGLESGVGAIFLFEGE